MYANGPDPDAPAEDWIADNGTDINGESLAQLITDSRNVHG
jgi:hypothetical protein